MKHRQAVLTMVAATLMWSIAGVVTRHLEAARSFEVTFWRSAFAALCMALLLWWLRGAAPLWRVLRQGGTTLWISGACWCVMFTAFMLALTLTSVANVLITMALGPLFTALLSRVVLRHALPWRTWVAIAMAGAGITWMYGDQFNAGGAQHLWGTLAALAVPLAAAINWTVLHHHRDDAEVDMLPAVLIGALLSSAVTLPLAWPFTASLHDVALLGGLGLVQLAVPCLMAVAAAKALSAPEASLLSLLEVVFGVAWAWWGAGEAPALAVLGGGGLVLAALVGNELWGLRRARVSP
ncbi:MAG: DMT family transporter [Rubrivivax sp.]|jgi:drug/metabolite transporter (DMT)-like permease